MIWPFHRHAWRVREAETGRVQRGTDHPVGSAITQVVEHCPTCNRVRSKLLPGHWTLDELHSGDTS